MESIARDVFENTTSHRAGELTTKSTGGRGPLTKSQQQEEPSKRDSPADLSRESSANPARRKRTKKAGKRTPQPPQNPCPTERPAEEVITPASHATNRASTAVIGTVKADFVADTEPVPQGAGFLCTFSLSRPGLVGLNKLAIHLNDLQDSGFIRGWQAKGWEDSATKVRTLIGFATRADALIAIKRNP